jgi:chemotaxis protein CheD
MTTVSNFTLEPVCVGMADYKTVRNTGVLKTLGLGSCLGVVIYDPATKICGLAHILLPDSKKSMTGVAPKKYADTALQMMLDEIIKLGAKKERLKAKIVGGACMFESVIADSLMNIGERNIQAVKKVLEEMQVPIVAEDTGKNYGRTIEFDAETCKLAVKSTIHGTKEI